MRKTTEPCPRCGSPLYLRSVAVGRGLRVQMLTCEAPACGYRDDPTWADDR